jgi:hypothetical protein
MQVKKNRKHFFVGPGFFPVPLSSGGGGMPHRHEVIFVFQ